MHVVEDRRVIGAGVDAENVVLRVDIGPELRRGKAQPDQRKCSKHQGDQIIGLAYLEQGPVRGGISNGIASVVPLDQPSGASGTT